VKPRRFRPRLHYELLVCGISGHELVGTDAAELRPEDRLVARLTDGVRWHRCLRCDSWLPFAPPAAPARPHPPDREEIELPLRGKPLRDKIVLRVIAVDRALHFVILGLLAVAIFLFAAHQDSLRQTFYRIVTDIQGGVGGGPVSNGRVGILHELDRLFSLRGGTLHRVGAAIAVYAVVEGLEAIGLWFQKRWAEYLTFLATSALLPVEVREIIVKGSWFKIAALVINLAIVIYLLLAKRLFGLRGGAKADEAERERDVGWEALERTAAEAVARAPT
jgi:uncharacterized membrane protein (DUF2068 family)